MNNLHVFLFSRYVYYTLRICKTEIVPSRQISHGRKFEGETVYSKKKPRENRERVKRGNQERKIQVRRRPEMGKTGPGLTLKQCITEFKIINFTNS